MRLEKWLSRRFNVLTRHSAYRRLTEHVFSYIINILFATRPESLSVRSVSSGEGSSHVALCSLARQTQTRNRTPVTPRRFFSARSVLPHCTQPAAMFSVGEACARPAAQPTMRTNGKSPLLARPTKDLLKDLPSGRERAGRRASATD